MLRTWIQYNRPSEPNFTHAGLLLAFGLHEHLRVLTMTDAYRYLSQVAFCPLVPLLKKITGFTNFVFKYSLLYLNRSVPLCTSVTTQHFVLLLITSVLKMVGENGVVMSLFVYWYGITFLLLYRRSMI